MERVGSIPGDRLEDEAHTLKGDLEPGWVLSPKVPTVLWNLPHPPSLILTSPGSLNKAE